MIWAIISTIFFIEMLNSLCAIKLLYISSTDHLTGFYLHTIHYKLVIACLEIEEHIVIMCKHNDKASNSGTLLSYLYSYSV
jgi:hypothetical protein